MNARKPLRFVAESPRLFSSVLLLLLILCIPSASHAQRRYFSGSYRVSNVTENNNDVNLTLSLTIHNFSGGDIRNCGVALYSTEGPRSKLLDAFDVIKVFPSFKDVTVSHEFTISSAEYERWKEGQSPNLQFLLSDGHGGTRNVPVDLRREVTPAALAK